jgi:hypothetical protein
MKLQFDYKKILIVITLVGVAATWRIINHNFMIAPNLEIVTAVSVLAALVFRDKTAVLVPIASMIFSDLVIGNSSIFVFTWGGVCRYRSKRPIA